jgi:hypothetical protein
MKLHGSLQKSGSSVSAERLIDSIATRFYLLADPPKVGRAREDFGACSFPVGNSVITQSPFHGPMRATGL